LRTSENEVLRRIIGTKREEVAEGWRTLHNEIQNWYTSPNIIRVINSMMKWEEHVAGMGDTRMHTKFWSEDLKGKDHSKTYI
jgi:hypothetical protein